MENAPGWWLRLGGPNAISRAAWLFTLVGGTAAAFSWIPTGGETRPWEWIGLSIVAQVILGCILLLAWRTYLSPRPRPSRTGALIATLLAAGWVRGAFLSYAGEQLNLVEDGHGFSRAIGASISFTVWYLLATLIVDGWRRHRELVTRLRDEMLREQELAERSASLISDFRLTVLEQTQAVLSQGLQSASAATSDPATAAASLRRTVDEVIRPLSHELERRAVGDAELLAEAEKSPTSTRIPLRTYVSGTFTARPFAPLATALVIIATPLIVVVHVLGPVAGVTSVLLAGIAVGLSLQALRPVVMRRIPGWPIPLAAALVITSWVGATMVGGALLVPFTSSAGQPLDTWTTPEGLSETGSTVTGLLALALTAMVAAAVEGSVEQQQRAAYDQLRNAVRSVEWSAARLRQRAWSEQRSLGRLLHGTVQATIVSAAIRIRDQSPEQAAVTIAGLTTRLQYTLGDASVTPWRREASNLADVWEGAISLTVVITESAERALDLDALAAHSLIQVLNESVTNAVRHGDADTVRVTVEGGPDYLKLTVMDDGTPAAARGVGGTGSRIFDANCADWQLALDSTTTLQARVACQSNAHATATGGTQ